MMAYKLGILTSHPIQYHAPLFRTLARQVDLAVYFAHRQTAQGQADAGFNVAFDWDVDLLSGYEYQFLPNRAKKPRVDRFTGCDTPDISDEIRNGDFDAFIVMGWYLKTYWQAIRACRRYGVPVMVRGDSHLHTPRSMLKQLIKEILYPRLLDQFDACLYVGQKNRDYLEHYGIPQERLFFSPHCVDNDWFRERTRQVDREASRARFGIIPNEKAVLFVGKFIEFKRPMDIVLALHILREQGLQVRGIFAGNGSLKNALETKAQSLNVPLTFLGFRNQSELSEVYAAGDVLALPSSGCETWGLVINEALACGTPVVVSDAVGCATDLVRQGHTGEVFPVGNVHALADALRRVLAGPSMIETIRTKAEEYSVKASTQGIIEALSQLSRNHKGGYEHGT